jgi:glyoxylase-like metal-dependent hydrolase (beta-lactamase superfamily II)
VLFLAWSLGVRAGERPPSSFEVVDVAPGVFAFVSPGTTSGVINGNSIAIVGDDGVLVVDSGQFPLATRRMIEEIRRRTDRPVRFLVNTHWHADHVLANQEYRRAFPGISVLAHDETRRLMLKNKERVLQLPSEGKGYYEALSAALKRGTRRDGSPFSDAEKAQLQDQVEDLGAIQAELPETRFDPADATFSDDVSVHLGKREVRLLHLGAGNTAGDVIVHVPDAGVAATGDVVVAPIPFGYGSHPAEWQGVLAKLRALDLKAFVPGHGPVQRDTRYLETLETLLRVMREQAAAASKAGLTLEAARANLDLRPVRREITQGDPLREGAFDAFFLDSAYAQAWKEAKGEPLEE